jgi:hypothetical protein
MSAVTDAPELPSEETLVVGAARDYVEGWFEGDAGRMERALHPELAKRSIDGDHVRTLTARQMIDATAEGAGKLPPEQRGIEVTVEHVDDGIANATVLSDPFVDYLQLARTEEGWKIVNVLWRRR